MSSTLSSTTKSSSDMPEVHPAARLFQSGDTEYVDALAQNIKTKGQLKAVVLTPDGLILEGRGRWAACRRAGVTPVVRTEREVNPWTYILNAHKSVFAVLKSHESAMIVGQVPSLGMIGLRKNTIEEPPSRGDMAELTGLTETTIYRAQRLCSAAISELIELVSDGMCSVSTGEGMSTASTDDQLRYVERVRAGESPTVAARAHIRSTNPRKRATPRKGLYLRANALQTLVDNLAALGMVLDSATYGLDPSITPDQAQTWLDELTRYFPAYTKITEKLKERKELDS